MAGRKGKRERRGGKDQGKRVKKVGEEGKGAGRKDKGKKRNWQAGRVKEEEEEGRSREKG